MTIVRETPPPARRRGRPGRDPQRPSLTPRKRPSQERAGVTVSAILEGAERVLLAEGQSGFTTRRIAELAGVSPGSFYQYFPNKEAVLAALIRARVEGIVATVEATARAARGPAAARVAAVLTALVAEKRRLIPSSRLYGPALALVEGRRIVAESGARLVAALAAMLADALGRPLTDGETGRLGIAVAAVEGVLSHTVETEPDRFADPAFGPILERLFLAALGLPGP